MSRRGPVVLATTNHSRTREPHIPRFWGRSVSSDAQSLRAATAFSHDRYSYSGPSPRDARNPQFQRPMPALAGSAGAIRFWSSRLWIAFLEPDNMMSAQLTQIEGIPRRADSKMCGSLLEMCRHVVGRNGAGGSVAMLLTRPGRNPLDDADRSWARCLTSAADHLSVSMWLAGALRERPRATGLRA